MPDRRITDPLWLGVDLGTQSVRVLVVDSAGHTVGSGSAPLTSHRDGPRHEQDPAQWWTALTAACAEALAGLDRARIAALAVDATSGTILLADHHGTPCTRALMYDDARATAEAPLAEAAGERLWAALGYRRLQPSWALPKLLWLLRDDPALAVRPSVRLQHQADHITSRLTGHPVATDASHALKTGYDLIDERWPTEIFDALGVPGNLLPEVVRPGTPIGAVCTESAAVTGIPAGTPVIAGMTDGCAAQLGAGALEPGSWNSVLGTTLVLKGVSKHLVADPNGIVYCHRGPGGTWLPGGASSSGAGVLSALFPGADLDELTGRAARRGPRAVRYPLIRPGERFPFRAPDAEPFTLGDTSDGAALFGAVLLGVACVERLCLDYLDYLGAPTDGALTFTGGATRNRYWTQLRTDMLGRTVRLPAQAEPALGMALLAATASGREPADLARDMVRVRTELDPRPDPSGTLPAAYTAFLGHLNERGWLPTAVATHAHRRIQP